MDAALYDMIVAWADADRFAALIIEEVKERHRQRRVDFTRTDRFIMMMWAHQFLWATSGTPLVSTLLLKVLQFILLSLCALSCLINAESPEALP